VNVSPANRAALEVNGPLDALRPVAATQGRTTGKKLDVPEYLLQHIRSTKERGTGRAASDSSRRREPPDREEDPSAVTMGRWKEGHDMTENTLLQELTAWHERHLADAENWDRLLSAHKELAWQEMSIRIGRPDLAGAERKAALARCTAARKRLNGATQAVQTGALLDEAERLLACAVNAGDVTYRLGTPGEIAVASVREIRAGRRPKFRADHALAGVVESGRLVAPTAARCVKCHVMRPMADLDAFTSPTSGETIHACLREQRPPEDRLGLDALGDLLASSWGQPCSVWNWPDSDP
jgi:hypothetical protein